MEKNYTKPCHLNSLFVFYPQLLSFKPYVRYVTSRLADSSVRNSLRLAKRIAEKLGIDSYPVDLSKIISYVGAVTIRRPLPSSVDGCVFKISKNFSNLLNKKFSNKGYIIMVNSRIPEVRQRFTIAHEVGHIILGHIDKLGYVIVENFSDWQNLENSARTKKSLNNFLLKAEIEANLFAGEILVPQCVLYNAVTELGIRSIKDLAEMFHVSLYVIYFQCELAGISHFITE